MFGVPASEVNRLRTRIAELQSRLEHLEQRSPHPLFAPPAPLAAFFDSLAVGIYVCEAPTGIIRWYNRTAAELWGRSPKPGEPDERFCGSYRLYRSDGVYLPHYATPAALILQTGVAERDVEVVIERPDGSRVTILASLSPLRDSQGGVAGFVNVMQDISERKRAEMRHQESEQRLRQHAGVLEQIHDAVLVWQLGAGITFWNRSAEQLYGYTAAEAVGRDPRRLLEPHATTGIAEIEAVLLHGETWSGERTHKVAGGGEIVVESRLVPVKHPDGTVVVLETNRDITARKKAESALRASEERFRSVFESAPLGFAQTEAPDYHFSNANEKFLEITGYAIDELRHMKPADLVHPDDRPTHMRAFSNLIEGVIPSYSFEKRYRRKTGEAVWVRSTVTLLRDHRGRPKLTLGIIEDITDRKRAENEITSTNAALLRANGDLEQFAYAAAHDLQEPLRNISLYAELLSRRYSGKLDGQASLYIGVLRDGAERMQSMVQDLLAYTRVSAGQDASAPVIDSRAVVEQVLEDLGSVIRGAAANVEVSDLPPLRVCDTHLRQLMQNLVSNALKYGKAGVPPGIRISGRTCDGMCEIRVADNGCGIAPEYRDQIFGVFKRLHGKDVPGTGIGLAICRRIVEQYGGSIWVESDRGAGATFCFTLPAA